MSIDSPTQTAQLNGPTHRSYQVRTAAALLSNPDTHHIVNIPVGGGKTETALEYIAAAYNDTPDSYTALITCPNGRLQSQWKARIEEYDLTDEELEAVKDSDFPIGEIPEPKEWEPVGTAEEWSIHTEDDTDT